MVTERLFLFCFSILLFSFALDTLGVDFIRLCTHCFCVLSQASLMPCAQFFYLFKQTAVAASRETSNSLQPAHPRVSQRSRRPTYRCLQQQIGGEKKLKMAFIYVKTSHISVWILASMHGLSQPSTLNLQTDTSVKQALPWEPCGWSEWSSKVLCLDTRNSWGWEVCFVQQGIQLNYTMMKVCHTRTAWHPAVIKDQNRLSVFWRKAACWQSAATLQLWNIEITSFEVRFSTALPGLLLCGWCINTGWQTGSLHSCVTAANFAAVQNVPV